MSPQRESVRGAGRDHPGATSVTMQIWYELDQAGDAGLTFDEIFEKVKPRVPPGYAWRAYSRYRSSSGSRLQTSPRSLLLDTPGNRASAARFVVRKSLLNMTRPDRATALKRPDGHFAVLRKPKSVFSDEQHDFDGSISRKAVAEMELARVVGPILEQIDEHVARGRNNPTISVKLAAALRRWYETQPAGQARLARLATTARAPAIEARAETNAEWLRREREARGLTKKALARLVGLSDTAIGNWEREKHPMNAGYRSLLEHFFDANP